MVPAEVNFVNKRARIEDESLLICTTGVGERVNVDETSDSQGHLLAIGRMGYIQWHQWQLNSLQQGESKAIVLVDFE